MSPLRAALDGDGVDLRCAVTTTPRRRWPIAELDERRRAPRTGSTPRRRPPRELGRRRRRAPPWPTGREPLHLGTLGLVLEPMASALAAGVGRLPTRHARACSTRTAGRAVIARPRRLSRAARRGPRPGRRRQGQRRRPRLPATRDTPRATAAAACARRRGRGGPRDRRRRSRSASSPVAASRSRSPCRRWPSSTRSGPATRSVAASSRAGSERGLGRADSPTPRRVREAVGSGRRGRLSPASAPAPTRRRRVEAGLAAVAA